MNMSTVAHIKAGVREWYFGLFSYFQNRVPKLQTAGFAQTSVWRNSCHTQIDVQDAFHNEHKFYDVK